MAVSFLQLSPDVVTQLLLTLWQCAGGGSSANAALELFAQCRRLEALELEDSMPQASRL